MLTRYKAIFADGRTQLFTKKPTHADFVYPADFIEDLVTCIKVPYAEFVQVDLMGNPLPIVSSTKC